MRRIVVVGKRLLRFCRFPDDRAATSRIDRVVGHGAWSASEREMVETGAEGSDRERGQL